MSTAWELDLDQWDDPATLADDLTEQAVAAVEAGDPGEARALLAEAAAVDRKG